jgi:hypothetical protein
MDGFDIRLLARRAEEADRGRDADGSAWRKGSVLAEKRFRIRRPHSETLFPVKNTSFERRGWESEALWYVEPLNIEECNEQSLKEVVLAHVNKDLDALQFLWNKSTPRRGKVPRIAANMVRKQIVAGLLHTVCRLVVCEANEKKGEEAQIDPDNGSATDVVLNLLEDVLSEEEQRKNVQLMVEYPEEVERKLQHHVGCGDAFDESVERDLREVM